MEDDTIAGAAGHVDFRTRRDLGRDDFLGERVPFPARVAAPLPLRMLGAALRAAIGGFGFHHSKVMVSCEHGRIETAGMCAKERGRRVPLHVILREPERSDR